MYKKKNISPKSKSIVSRVLVCLFAVCTLASCGKKQTYTIEGTLYGGKNFEDQIIYLVPFSGATSENIDSAVIHDSRFRFSGEAETDEVYILRMRPMMRLFIDELIIIREPGRIKTRLSQVSSAKGTPQNDSLQHWREFKMHIDSALTDVRKKMKRAQPEEYKDLRLQQDSIRAVFDRHNKQSITLNNNAFGDFLSKYAK